MSAEGTEDRGAGSIVGGLTAGKRWAISVKLPLLNGQVPREYTISCKMYMFSFLLFHANWSGQVLATISASTRVASFPDSRDGH